MDVYIFCWIDRISIKMSRNFFFPFLTTTKQNTKTKAFFADACCLLLKLWRHLIWSRHKSNGREWTQLFLDGKQHVVSKCVDWGEKTETKKQKQITFTQTGRQTESSPNWYFFSIQPKRTGCFRPRLDVSLLFIFLLGLWLFSFASFLFFFCFAFLMCARGSSVEIKTKKKFWWPDTM